MMIETITCPKCYHLNSSDALHCSRCHTPLEKKEKECPACKAFNLQDKRNCVVCGFQFYAEENLPIDLEGIESENSAERLTKSIASNFPEKMLKDIRSWAIFSLVLGLVHMILSGFLNSPWGILLVIVGLSSFYFQTASMFIIYTIILAWAGFQNILLGEGLWKIFAVLQLYLAFRVFQQYRKYRDVELKQKEEGNLDSKVESSYNRASRWFPWMGFILGLTSFLGLLFAVLIAIGIALGSEGNLTLPGYLVFAEGVAVNFGILGFSIGLASLNSGYPKKALSWIGLIAGIVTILLQLVTIFLA